MLTQYYLLSKANQRSTPEGAKVNHLSLRSFEILHIRYSLKLIENVFNFCIKVWSG